MEETNVTTEPSGVDLPEGVSIQTWTKTDQIQFGEENDSSLLDENSVEEQQPETEQSKEPEAKPEETLQQQVDKHTKTIDALKKDLRSKGVDFNVAVKEYTEFGTISSKTLADLAQAGYPKEVVEAFIESRQAIEEKFTAEVYKSAGGEQEYNNIISWASANLPKKTVEAFNRAIDSNNLGTIGLMLEGIKARMVSQQGTRNPSIVGNASNRAPQKGFADKDAMIKAMSDKRYGRDAKYTREVEYKMLYTDF